MTILDSLTLEILGLIVTIAGLFGGAMFWLGIVHNKLNSIEKNVNNLMKETRALSIRIESHILSLDAREESEKRNKKE